MLVRWIAKAYLWVYHKLLQRPISEPFTRQADRIERRWPFMAWGIALSIFFTTARFIDGWWLLITAAVYLFALWFIPHITSYQRAHPENVPFKQWYENRNDRLLAWAKKRVRK